jgi:23S rRNA (uracil1939-C5)-methyltransferase
VLLPDERAGERGHDERLGIRARLGMLCACDSEDIPRVLDQYVLEAASGGDERNAALARDRDGAECALHAPVRTCRCDPEPRETLPELVGWRHRVGWDPLALGLHVGQAGIERRVGFVPGLVVADDADQHAPTLPFEAADTIASVAAPLRKDQELDLHVDSLAFGGNGVARLNGFVVFVRRALPGDTVRARITKVKRNHAEADALEIVEAGAPRVEAPCQHYPACGGCRFQDLAYEAQVEAKAHQVADALSRIGRLEGFELEPIVPAASIFHYRNKLEYSFKATDDGLVLGFHRAGRWDEILDIERCWLTTDLGNEIRNAVKSWAREQGLTAYDQETHEGYLRHLVVREGRNTGQVLVVLVTAPGELPAETFIETVQRFPQVRSIHWAINDRPAEITNVPSRLLWGDEAIEEEILGLRFRVRPNAFLQTNTEMAETLYSLAIQYAALTGEESVYDLYCGTGTIGISMAREALTVWGIEASEESVACAVENAELNGIANTAFFAGEVGADVEELRERAGPPDVVVVDPPRSGLVGKALARVGALEAPRLVYVSCNPTTLAGNAKELVSEFGYTLERVRPVDMFPHTPHVESVALFTR